MPLAKELKTYYYGFIAFSCFAGAIMFMIANKFRRVYFEGLKNVVKQTLKDVNEQHNDKK